MTLKSIIDPKKRKKVLEALKKNDPSLLKSKAATPLLSTDPNKSLLSSASHGDLDGVKNALNENADVNTRNFNGRTPLISALIQHRDISLRAVVFDTKTGKPMFPDRLESYKEVIEFLIESGADVNARDEAGKSTLCHAARCMDKSFEDLLRQHGAKE
jgi:ankyrin repeat protein